MKAKGYRIQYTSRFFGFFPRMRYTDDTWSIMAAQNFLMMKRVAKHPKDPMPEMQVTVDFGASWQLADPHTGEPQP